MFCRIKVFEISDLSKDCHGRSKSNSRNRHGDLQILSPTSDSVLDLYIQLIDYASNGFDLFQTASNQDDLSGLQATSDGLPYLISLLPDTLHRYSFDHFFKFDSIQQGIQKILTRLAKYIC
jgi:hypothetical protein